MFVENNGKSDSSGFHGGKLKYCMINMWWESTICYGAFFATDTSLSAKGNKIS